MNLRELHGVVATDKHEQAAYVKPRAKTRAGAPSQPSIGSGQKRNSTRRPANL
jgi:hypothetical protein